MSLRKHCIITTLLTILLSASGAWGTTYYVSNDGNDSLAGTSELLAWKTIAKVNESSFGAGDSILLNRGDEWREQLTVPSSGSEGSVITFGVYGSGANPLIRRTTAWSSWWRVPTDFATLYNGGFENYAAGDTTDNFAEFSEGVTGDYTLKADTTVYHSANTSAKLSGSGGGSYAALTAGYTVVDSTTYYLSFWGRVSTTETNALVLRIKDSGNTKYLDSSGVWQSSSATYAVTFNAEAANTWVNKIVTIPMPASGSTTVEIKFYAWANGSAWIDDFFFTAGSSLPATAVWGAYAGGSKMYGATLDGTRTLYTSTAYPATMADHYFSGASSVYGFYRDDTGMPGEMEIGTRNSAILIDGKNYITVDGIDVTGPGGGSGSETYHLIDVRGVSDNIAIKNLHITNASNTGLQTLITTSNVTIDNCTATSNATTGIYSDSVGGANYIQNSISHDNGKLASDTGDSGGIGCYQCSNMIIQGNIVYSNGRTDGTADAEISIVDAAGSVRITKNHVYDCIQGCIQTAEDSNDTIIDANIIDGFGTSSDTSLTSGGYWAGIRIGGGSSGCARASILNNTIVNGGDCGYAALCPTIYFSAQNNRLATVRNNLLSNNAQSNVYVTTGATTTGTVFDHNLYYGGAGSWYWKGTTAATLAAWISASSMTESGTLNANPLLDSDLRPAANSPAIDHGNATICVQYPTDCAGRNQLRYGRGCEIGAYAFPAAGMGGM